MLLAWSVDAIPSPLLIAYVRQTTGHHDPALYTLAAVMLVATLVPLAARRPAPGPTILRLPLRSRDRIIGS